MSKKQRKQAELEQRWLALRLNMRRAFVSLLKGTPIRVRCLGNRIHKIGLSSRGRLYLEQHPKEVWEEDLAMSAIAGGKVMRCLRVVSAWKQMFKGHPPGNGQSKAKRELPQKLRSLPETLRELRKKHWPHRPEFESELSTKHIFGRQLVTRELTKAIISADEIWPRSFHAVETRKTKLFVYVSFYSSADTYIDSNVAWMDNLRIHVDGKHWLLKVYKAGLQVVDGYPVLRLRDQRDIGSDAYLKADVIRNVSGRAVLQTAIFHKPLGRKAWWKAWQQPDNGQVWRLKEWR